MVVRYEDMFFQSLLIDFKEDFLNFFNINFDKDYSEIFINCENLGTDDYWVNLEIKDENNPNNIKKYTITTKEVKTNEFLLSLKKFDGDTSLKIMEELIKSKNNLTSLERFNLILIPLMHTKKDIYCLLCETVCLTNKIKEISLEDLRIIKVSQYLIMQRFVKDKTLKELLMEEITMEANTIKLFDKIREEEIIFEGKKQIALKMLNENFSITQIRHITNLSVEEIEEII